MTSASNSFLKTTNQSNDDLFLCRAFAKAISSEKLIQTLEQQIVPTVELNIASNEIAEIMDESTSPSDSIQWKIGDLCLCPYSEDGLLYRATIIQIDSLSCTISFDDYGNEESHPLTDLQIRTEDDYEQEQEEGEIEEEEETVPTPINETDILPPPPPPPLMPPFPSVNSTDDNDSLSSTLMSWYLAGYHTGFYQGIKNQKV